MLLRVFGSLNKRLYRFIENGAIGRYLSGYESSCERLNKSILGRLLLRIKRKACGGQVEPIVEELPDEAYNIVTYEESSIRRGLRDRFAEKFDQSKLVGAARKFKNRLLHTPLVTYGLIVFGFALFLLISQALTLFFAAFDVPLGMFTYALSDDTVLTVAYMAAAVVLMALSLIWVFAQNISLASFMLDSIIIGSLIGATTGVTQISKTHTDGKVIPRRAGFFIGAFLGILTFLATPQRFFAVLLIAFYLMIVANVPEFGLMITVFSLPYLSFFEHPTAVALFFVISTMLSTLLKLLRGKRTYRFEMLDVYVVLFLLLVLFGGIVTVGGLASTARALTLVVLGVSYFTVKVLVRDEAWLRRCVNALVASSVPVSILAILEFALGKASTAWQDTSVFASISGRVSSLWGNPNILAEFLLVAFFFSLGRFLTCKRLKEKFPALIAMTINGAGLIFTWSRGAWIALAVTLIGIALLYSHRALPFVFLAVLAFVALFVFLPESFILRVESSFTFEDSSTLYRIHIWEGCAALIRDVFWSGVGVGEEAFRTAYLPYALSGIEDAPHAHNLAMQIVIELGIVGLLVFVLMLISLARVVFTLFAKCRMKHTVSLYALGVYGAFSALLLHGVTEYVWYNLRIYLLFFVLIGLLSAARRIGTQSMTERLNEADRCDFDYVIAR